MLYIVICKLVLGTVVCILYYGINNPFFLLRLCIYLPATKYIFTIGCATNLKLFCLTASPQVTLQNVKLAEDHMTVTWLYKVESLRRKRSERSTDTNVSVVIFYQPNGGEESRYPPEGSLAAEVQEATINGQFDPDVKYSVWLKVYEGQLVVSSQQTTSVEAQVDKGKKVKFLSSHTL